MNYRISSAQRQYLAFIAQSDVPVCAADVDRACRRNPRAGHKWVYDSVQRLASRGFVSRTEQGSRKVLELTSLGRRAVQA